IVDGADSQIRYSVPEEQDHGTFVGNIAEDLSLDITKLSSRRFQTVPSSRSPYLEVNLENGVLFVNEKIDREQICKQSATCLLHLEVFLENPLELFRVEIEIVDINDNPPSFPETDITVEISESATPGTRFPLETAFDPDVGANALRTYEITTNNYFYLDVQTQSDGNKFAELVLEKPLDREQQAVHRYVLTAVDGGLPQRTGTALLVVRVLDSNDNVPVFDQPVYTVNLPENSPVGTLVIQLNATDMDEGQNGEVVYSFSNHIAPRVKDLFSIDARTGRIEVSGDVDFEESSMYQIYVQAKDLGPNAVPAHCKVLVKVMDGNDNPPEITFSTMTESVHCEILGDTPFKLKSSFRNYYTIVTDGPLDRENADSYTVTVVAKDRGAPSLATSKSIKVQVSDENDNAPVFTQQIFDAYVTENNVPGAYIYAVSALDPDMGQNAYISYSIMECDIQGMSVSTYVSINSENGYLYALRSFDYEQLKDFSFMVQAKDSGSPELSSNATVNVIIGDQNDNAPSVIAPVGKNGTAKEPLPRSAEPGYLVTRIVAMDADDGENARLSYSIQKGNENGMFRMDWRTGELRTARRVSSKRDPNQLYDLLIEVRDHGQPPLSSTASVIVMVTKHQRAELSYLVDRPRRVNSSAFQEADIVSSKDSGHGDSEQGDSDHDATNRGHSSGADLFSNCTEECKALGHSDRCWMPSFVPSDGRQAADYRSNLHVPGMDSVPDTEIRMDYQPTKEEAIIGLAEALKGLRRPRPGKHLIPPTLTYTPTPHAIALSD
ncbi:protocadherin-10-like, partial [Scleropages formosus]